MPVDLQVGNRKPDLLLVSMEVRSEHETCAWVCGVVVTHWSPKPVPEVRFLAGLRTSKRCSSMVERHWITSAQHATESVHK